jgi:hypothetical protein
MLKTRDDLYLAEEPIRADRGSKLRMQDLQRYCAPVSNIVREIDAAHAAATDFTLDDVSAGECFVQK